MATIAVPRPTSGLIQNKTTRGFRQDLWVPGAFDYDLWEDSFIGDEIDTIYPTASTDTGTVTFTEHNLRGFLEFKTSAGLDKYAGQGIGLQWSGDIGVLAEFVVTLPADITVMKFEVGLADADDAAGMVNQKGTTSTATGTDFAVFVFDTTDDSNIALITAKGGAVVERQDLFAPVVSTTYRFAIRVDGDNVEAYVNGLFVAGTGGNAGIEGGTPLTPWVFCQARSGSERILQLRKWRVTWPVI